MENDDAQEMALGRLFLGRLSRLVTKETVVTTPEERTLVDWAIYSTCCDCYDLGLHDAVTRILAMRQPKHRDRFERWMS